MSFMFSGPAVVIATSSSGSSRERRYAIVSLSISASRSDGWSRPANCRRTFATLVRVSALARHLERGGEAIPIRRMAE